MNKQEELPLNILTIDTATNIEILSVVHNNRIADQTSEVGVSHSQTIFSHLDSALKELNISINDIVEETDCHGTSL